MKEQTFVSRLEDEQGRMIDMDIEHAGRSVEKLIDYLEGRLYL